MSIEELPSSRAMRLQENILHVEIGAKLEDSRIIWTDVSAAPLQFPDTGCVVVTADITERKRLEAELIERVQLAQFQATVAATLSPEDLSVLLNTCCQSLVDAFGGAFARIWTLNEKEQVLELQASAGRYTT